MIGRYFTKTKLHIDKHNTLKYIDYYGFPYHSLKVFASGFLNVNYKVIYLDWFTDEDLEIM